MTELIIGLVLFFAPHSVSIFAADWRDRQAQRLGVSRWKLVYSLLSIAGLILIVSGYALARQSPTVLWLPPAWLRHATMLLMLPVFVLLIAAYVPSRIGRWARHPMLVAVKLWALAHLLSNGTLPDVVLFGSFLIWAVADRISLKQRQPRATPHVPLSGGGDLIALIGGIAMYAAFVFWLHTALIGRALVT